ncbi:hypothetical protein OG601_24330 [Streptomyces sp. NBC_01239]|nr:hypothetical protein [Streptomyces sp. NBC_01239]MCX4813728.1 hypothetical protein [Streptomyces sp. NBC_01239]
MLRFFPDPTSRLGALLYVAAGELLASAILAVLRYAYLAWQ